MSKMKGMPCCLGLIYCLAFLFVPAKCGIGEPSKQLTAMTKKFDGLERIVIYQGGSSGMVVYGKPELPLREKFQIQYDGRRHICVASQSKLRSEFSYIGKYMPDGITFHLRDQLKLFVWLMPFGHLTLRMPDGSAQNFSAIMQHGREEEAEIMVKREKRDGVRTTVTVDAPKVAEVLKSESIVHFLIALNEKDEFLGLFTVKDGQTEAGRLFLSFDGSGVLTADGPNQMQLLSFDKGSGVFTIPRRQSKIVGIDMTLPPEDFGDVARFAMCSRDGKDCFWWMRLDAEPRREAAM